MDARKQPILVETKTFILKEALVDSDGESVWFITDSQNKNISFFIGGLHGWDILSIA